MTYPFMVGFLFSLDFVKVEFLSCINSVLGICSDEKPPVYFPTMGFITPCLAHPIPWRQTEFYSSTPKNVFMKTFSFLCVNASFCQSIFFLCDNVLGYFPTLE